MLINPYVFGYTPADANAIAYIAAVEAADGTGLESGVKQAINDFVVGCKADGTWNAIKASCILAGARTLAGALVPLVGTAPTNNNFVSGDYNRKTGLVGDGSTKYLDSNRLASSQVNTNMHLAVRVSNATGADTALIGATQTSGATSITQLISNGSESNFTINAQNITSSSLVQPGVNGATTGFWGASRNAAASYQGRINGSNYTFSFANNLASSYAGNVLVFARTLNGSPNGYSGARLAYYSIGESLDLALLDTRVTTLINAFAAAIP